MICLIFSNESLYFYVSKDRSTQTYEGKIERTNNEAFRQSLKEKLRKILSEMHTDEDQISRILFIHQHQDSVEAINGLLNKLTEELNFTSHVFLTEDVSKCLMWSIISHSVEHNIILNAVDEPSRIYYFLPNFAQHNRSLSLKHFGYSYVASNMTEVFYEHLNSLGLHTEKNILEQNQILKGIKNKQYDLHTSMNTTHIQLDIQYSLQESKIHSYFKRSNKELKNYLSPELLNDMEQVNLILAGSYFDEAETIEFLKGYLGKQNITYLGLYSNEEIYSNIARGAFKMGYFKYDQQRKQLLENHKEKLEVKQRLVSEVYSKIQDEDEIQAHISYFKNKAKEVGVPFEVVEWHILRRQEELRLKSELEQLNDTLHIGLPLKFTGKPTIASTNEVLKKLESKKKESSSIIIDDDDYEEGTNHDEIDDTDEKLPLLDVLERFEIQNSEGSDEEIKDESSKELSLEPSLERRLEAFQVTDFTLHEDKLEELQLENIIETERIFANGEFILLRGHLKGSKISRIFRIISTNELKNIQRLQRFRTLYERESAYYNEVSKVFRSNFGLFYYREYVEGDKLYLFAKKMGLTTKKELDELNASDLKLIFQVWKTIRELPFSYSNFDADNIIISSSSQWPQEGTLGVHMVGLRSTSSPKQEMIARMHDIFSEILDSNMYQKFREKYK